MQNTNDILQVVKLYAKQDSQCLRAKIGVAICTGEKNELRLLYLSHNGPVGTNKCSNEKGQCGCFHAEIRAVMKVLQGPMMLPGDDNWIIVCNWTPCTTCANFILQYAPWLNEWYYGEEYRNPRGMRILRSAGIICERIENA